MPDEVYAIGFRNPHTLASSQDADGETHLFVADVGRDNAEEINRVVPGGNYGWSEFEGIFSLQTNPGTLVGVEPLSPEDTDYAIAEQAIFPASFIGHFGFIEFDEDGNPIDGQVGGGQAIASGYSISTASVLNGLYIFGDFAKGGRFYEAELEALLAVNSTMPVGGTIGDVDWVTPEHMTLLFDHDNDPTTTPLLYSNILDAISKTRSDIRFNQGPNGEMYITTKRDGTVYVVANGDPNYDDIIFGTDGDDSLFGYGGDDLVFGDLGDDTIIISSGMDTVTGGLGANTFVFTTEDAIDEVTDYQPGYDILDLHAWSDIGVIIQQRVAGDEIELVRQDTGAVIGILRGAALEENAGSIAGDDRFDVLFEDVAAAGINGVSIAAPGIFANNGDQDSDTFSLSAVEGLAANIGQWVAGSNGGSFRVFANGEVEFADSGATLPVDQTTEISYTITDADGASDTATVVVRMGDTPPDNEAPTAVTNLFVATEGTDGGYTRFARVNDGTTILDNDTDPEDDPLSIVAINDNGFNVSVAGASVWFEGDNGGEFRVFDTGVVDFRFDAEDFVSGGSTGFDYSIVDGVDNSAKGRVDILWGGFANDDTYILSTADFNAAGAGIVVVGSTNDNTDALENGAAGSSIVALNGDVDGIGTWIAGSNGGEFRVFETGVVQFRNQGDAVSLGDVTTIDYNITAPGAAGGTNTATISLAVGDGVVEDEAIDDVYTLTGEALADAGRAWLRLGALNDGTHLLADDGDLDTINEINGAELVQGAWFDGDNGGQFRVSDRGVVDFRNQGTELMAGESTSFSCAGVSADGVANTAMVSLVIDDFAFI